MKKLLKKLVLVLLGAGLMPQALPNSRDFTDVATDFLDGAFACATAAPMSMGI